MPLLERVTAKVTDRLPSMISPRLHALLEYASAAGFLLYASSVWERDQQVAISSAGCGLFVLVNSALTDYAERDSAKLSLDSHGRLDLGLAALIGTIPSLMGLNDKYDKRFFRVQAVALAALAGLTDFSRTGERKQLKNIEKTGRASSDRAMAA